MRSVLREGVKYGEEHIEGAKTGAAHVEGGHRWLSMHIVCV